MIRKRINTKNKTKIFIVTCDSCKNSLDKAGYPDQEQAINAMTIKGWKLEAGKVECKACNLKQYNTFKPNFVTERKPPEDTKCHGCGKSEGLKITSTILSGPFAGHLKCSLCGYGETVMSHVARNMVKVEPLSLPSGGLNEHL